MTLDEILGRILGAKFTTDIDRHDRFTVWSKDGAKGVDAEMCDDGSWTATRVDAYGEPVGFLKIGINMHEALSNIE
jgi:hypothetical protein